MDAGYAGNARYEADTAEVTPSSVTEDIIARLDHNIGIATEVRARLWGLRDRLFGPQPPAADGIAQGEKRSPANSFEAASRMKGFQLRDILNDIDALSAHLTNRL
jgi:hypothetical protein